MLYELGMAKNSQCFKAASRLWGVYRPYTYGCVCVCRLVYIYKHTYIIMYMYKQVCPKLVLKCKKSLNSCKKKIGNKMTSLIHHNFIV